MQNGYQTINLTRLENGATTAATDQVIIETPITIMVQDVGNFTLMATPCEVKELAVGFLFSEGLITSITDVAAISALNPNSNSIGIELINPDLSSDSRNLIVTSSCGFCGQKNIEKLIKTIAPVNNKIELKSEQVFTVINSMCQQQKLQQLTGSTHAAGIFNNTAEILALSEDVGRHSALDKVIGKYLLSEKQFIGCGVVLSSRVSFEMVVKTARAGMGMVIAVSGATSLAIEMAKKWNITLYGFVRNDRLNCY